LPLRNARFAAKARHGQPDQFVPTRIGHPAQAMELGVG
jgi:hypothetical protein